MGPRGRLLGLLGPDVLCIEAGLVWVEELVDATDLRLDGEMLLSGGIEWGLGWATGTGKNFILGTVTRSDVTMGKRVGLCLGVAEGGIRTELGCHCATSALRDLSLEGADIRLGP